MNAHSKPARIVTLEGIFYYDPQTGFYERYEPDPRSRHRGLILVAACLIGWAAFIGAGYAIGRAVEAIAG